MNIHGAQILAYLALIASFITTLMAIGDPTITLVATWASVVVTALVAGVTAAIQLGILPELKRLGQLQAQVSGTQILAFLALIASLLQTLMELPNPAIAFYAKLASVIVTALVAAVTAAIQWGIIPEMHALAARRK